MIFNPAIFYCRLKTHFTSKRLSGGITDIELRHTSYSRFGFPRHFHDYYTLIVPEIGIITETDGYELHPGTLFFFGPGDIHAGESKGAEPVGFTSVTISSSWIQQVLGDDLRSFRFGKILTHDERTRYAVRQLIDQLASLRGDHTLGVESALAQLLPLLSLEEPSIPLGNPSFVATVKDYIQDNFAQQFTLQELADLSGVSPYHLSRTFKKQTGLSPFNFAQNVRVERAKRHMKEGMTWARAAAANGFYDQSHFYRYFKRMHGVPPGEWYRRP